jgi:hypothetical protein
MQIPVLIAIAFFVLGLRPAHAYIDPGSGSLVFQVVVGALLGGVYMLRSYARAAIAFIFRSGKRSAGEADRSDQNHD